MTIEVYSILNLGYCIFKPSMASLHHGNQFMYHMTIGGNCWAFFFHIFIYLFIHWAFEFVSVHKNAMKPINDTSLLWYVSACFEFLYFWLIDMFDTIHNLPRFSVSVSEVSPYHSFRCFILLSIRRWMSQYPG